MKITLLALSLFSFLFDSGDPEPETEIVRARITYYTDDPKWGDQTADPNTGRCRKGVTVAAHPDFDFGTTIYIEGLENHFGDEKFIVQDRGSWVTKKKAARGKGYVFDVYVNSAAEVRRLSRKMPEWMEVEIVKSP